MILSLLLLINAVALLASYILWSRWLSRVEKKIDYTQAIATAAVGILLDKDGEQSEASTLTKEEQA